MTIWPYLPCVSGNPDTLICGNCRECFSELTELLDHKKSYCKLRFTCKCQELAFTASKLHGRLPRSLSLPPPPCTHICLLSAINLWLLNTFCLSAMCVYLRPIVQLSVWMCVWQKDSLLHESATSVCLTHTLTESSSLSVCGCLQIHLKLSYLCA